MARRLSRKELLKQDEVQEAALEAGHWIEENAGMIVRTAVAVVVVVVLLAGFFWFQHRRAEDARREFASAVAEFEALDADGRTDPEALQASIGRFESLSDRRPVGPLATYYRAVALREAGRDEEALAILETLHGDSGVEPTLAGSVTRLLADVYLHAGREDEAYAMLEKQVDGSSPAGAGLAPELALLEMARIARANGDLDRSRQYLLRVRDDYPATAAATEAQRLLGS